MKALQVNKLYSKLSPHEQAALAFEAISRLDDDDFQCILGSVEEKNYIAPDFNYQQRLQGLTNLGSVYGIVYWKTLCRLYSILGLYADDESFLETTIIWIKKLGSMDIALESVCQKLKVDITAVRILAECNDYHQEFKGKVDDEWIEYYTTLFTNIVYFETA